MKHLFFPLLGALVAFAPLAVADPILPADGAVEHFSLHQADKKKKTKKRDPRKEATRKKKELREMGVKNVRVASPGDWPKGVPVPKETVLESKGQQPGVGFVYETNNYRFHSPVALDEAACETVGRLFECAYAANKAVGEVLPVPRTADDRSAKKYLVELWPTKQQYISRGAPADSAGLFSFAARRSPAEQGKPLGPLTEAQIAMDKVMVPFESLGLGSNGSVVSRDINTHVLVHELTHQNFVRNGLPIWANEGWAEYLGYIPYVGETLDFNRGFSMVLHEAKKRNGTGALNFPFSLEEFLTMDQPTMYSHMSAGKDTYLLSVMLISFYVHLDGKKGVEAMKAYMQALLDNSSHADAAQELIKPHRDAARLEKDFIKMWKRRKVEVSFGK